MNIGALRVMKAENHIYARVILPTHQKLTHFAIFRGLLTYYAMYNKISRSVSLLFNCQFSCYSSGCSATLLVVSWPGHLLFVSFIICFIVSLSIRQSVCQFWCFLSVCLSFLSLFVIFDAFLFLTARHTKMQKKYSFILIDKLCVS